MSRAKIISFINYKGGVGKTTTTYHIGCSLAYHKRKKVLLVDIDPQTNLTFLCIELQKWEAWKDEIGTIKTLYERFMEKKNIDTEKIIFHRPIYTIETLDLLPSDLELLGEDLSDISPQVFSSNADPIPIADIKRINKRQLRQYKFLKKILSEVENAYDYILIDCPPNLYMTTQNALIASDYYVITTIPEYLSSIGVRILQQKIGDIGKKIRRISDLTGGKYLNMASLLGIIFVKVRIGGQSITKRHRGGMKQLKKDYPSYCFKTYTTELIGYSEAAELMLPVWLTDTDNARRAAGKLQYEHITDEFINKLLDKKISK